MTIARLATRPARQRGVALIVALVLLLIVTLLAVGSMRGTALQERVSANMYDRSVAFQRSEAAMRAAEAAITADWRIANLGGLDCSAAGANNCSLVPPNTFTSDNTNWVTTGSVHSVNSTIAPGTPQYRIEFMGTGPSESNYGVDANADYGNYGSAYPPDSVAYYRVTARSSNPGDATDRSVVVLQSTYKRAF
jgi:type IV pilus assembly protein PilX